jgi:hypothetical protein
VERGGTVRLWVSQSVLAAITAAGTSIAVQKAQGPGISETGIRDAILREIATLYVPSREDGLRWTLHAKNLEDKLGAIERKLTEVDVTTREIARDIPDLRARVNILERGR